MKQAWKERQLAIAEQRRIDDFYDRLQGCPVTGGPYTNIDGASADNYAAGVVLFKMVSVLLVFSTTLQLTYAHSVPRVHVLQA